MEMNSTNLLFLIDIPQGREVNKKMSVLNSSISICKDNSNFKDILFGSFATFTVSILYS